VRRAALSKIFDALKEAELAAQSRSAPAGPGLSSLGAKLLVLTSGPTANANATSTASASGTTNATRIGERRAPFAWKHPLLWFALGVTLTATAGLTIYRHGVGSRPHPQPAASTSVANPEQKPTREQQAESKSESGLRPEPKLESKSSQPRATRPQPVPSEAVPAPVTSPQVASAASGDDAQPSDAVLPALPESSRGFVLQVATMRNEENADALTNVLHQRNFAAFVSRRGSRPQYSVLVGVYADSDTAHRAKDELERQGLTAIFLRWSPE
jgi:cell division septation protein DedD